MQLSPAHASRMRLPPPPAASPVVAALAHVCASVCGPVLVAVSLCCISMVEVSAAGFLLLATGIWALLAPKRCAAPWRWWW